MTKSEWGKAMVKKQQRQQGSATRGGYRDNAGRKSGWQNRQTCTIRIPKTLAVQLLELAHRLDKGEKFDNETKSKCREDDLVTKANLGETAGCGQRGTGQAVETVIDTETKSKLRKYDTVTESILDRVHPGKPPEVEGRFDNETKSMLARKDFVTKSDDQEAKQLSQGSLPELTAALQVARTIIKAKKSARESIRRLLSKLYSVTVGPEDLR